LEPNPILKLYGSFEGVPFQTEYSGIFTRANPKWVWGFAQKKGKRGLAGGKTHVLGKKFLCPPQRGL